MGEEKKKSESNQDKGFGTVQKRLLSAEFGNCTNKETEDTKTNSK